MISPIELGTVDCWPRPRKRAIMAHHAPATRRFEGWPLGDHPLEPGTAPYAPSQSGGVDQGTVLVWQRWEHGPVIAGEQWPEDTLYGNIVVVDVEVGVDPAPDIDSIRDGVRQMRGARDIIRLHVHRQGATLLEEDIL